MTNPYGEQITAFKTHPIRFLSLSNTGVASFGYDGEIYTLNDGVPAKVNIEIYKDQISNSVTPIKVRGNVSDFSVSPNGKEVAFIHRGEVFVTSVEYATTKRITNTPEQERNVSFSPDGTKLLYAGERNNSWNIYESEIVRDAEKHFYNATLIKETLLVDNKEETFQPNYSPDGKEVAFLENRTTIRVINLKSKKVHYVDSILS